MKGREISAARGSLFYADDKKKGQRMSKGLEWVADLKRHPDIIRRMGGFRDLTPLHGKWIRQMVWGNEDYTLQAHRGSYKSSCLAVAISMILVFFQQRNVIFLRKTDNDILASAAWRGADTGPLRTGDVVENGFALWADSYDDQSDADRAAHKAVPISVGLVMAGRTRGAYTCNPVRKAGDAYECIRDCYDLYCCDWALAVAVTQIKDLDS